MGKLRLFLFGLGLITSLEVSAGSIEIRSVAEDVWLHVSWHTFENGSRYSSNGLVVRQNGGLILVDSAWGDENTIALLETIQEQIGLPVQMAIATHAHPDRASGAEIFEARNIPFFAHPETRRLAGLRGMTVPQHTLDMPLVAGSVAKLGPLEVLYPGAGHATDNLVVWLANHKLLFGGCAVRPGDAADLGYYADGDPATWEQAINIIKGRFGGASLVVPGHGRIGSAELLDHTISLVQAHFEAAK